MCYLSCSVPQGSIIGPLQFLIYINDLPNILRSAFANLFADDTNISHAPRKVHEFEPLVNSELANFKTLLIAIMLSLSIAKTEFLVIGLRQKTLTDGHSKMCVQIGDRMIKQVGHTKSLGSTIDDHLSWSKHVDEWNKKISSAIEALKRIRPYILLHTAVQIYNSLILQYFDYCCSV